MRNCPVCLEPKRTQVGSLTYHIPDGWPLPAEIAWYVCDACGMLYGDGEFDQQMLDLYYLNYYGYGLQYPENVERLNADAWEIAKALQNEDAVIVDFGGAGDDGTSVVAKWLRGVAYKQVYCIGPADPLPPKCDLIFASHVLEHIYDLPKTMDRLVDALAPGGIFVMDGPDAAGLVRKWDVPILDFNTKHINHFTLRDYLNLGHRYGLEMVQATPYAIDFVPAGYQIWFDHLDVAAASIDAIRARTFPKAASLRLIEGPVNVWGLNDLAWHLLSMVELEVLDYIDNDPAYRGKTYNGKPVVELPTNDAPIVVMVQGQRKRLIEHIRNVCQNRIVEI